MLQARQPLTEIVDTSGIRAMSASYVLNQFTGWAVADAQGKTIQELASQMMLDLSERVLHLNGDVEQMSDLAGRSQHGAVQTRLASPTSTARPGTANRQPAATPG